MNYLERTHLEYLDYSEKGNLNKDFLSRIPYDNPEIIFNTNEKKYIENLYISLGGSLLDIYFILNIYNNDNINNSELIIGYFGGNHTRSINDFLTIHMNRYILQYKYDNELNGIRRIPINENIDLNRIFGYTVGLIKTGEENNALIIHPTEGHKIKDHYAEEELKQQTTRKLQTIKIKNHKKLMEQIKQIKKYEDSEIKKRRKLKRATRNKIRRKNKSKKYKQNIYE